MTFVGGGCRGRNKKFKNGLLMQFERIKGVHE